MSKKLIVIGLALVLIGVLWPWISKVPFGRLPGDYLWKVGGVRVYVPLGTSLLISFILTIVLWLFGK